MSKRYGILFVLSAPSGGGKSTLLRELVGEEWFLETEMDLDRGLTRTTILGFASCARS